MSRSLTVLVAVALLWGTVPVVSAATAGRTTSAEAKGSKAPPALKKFDSTLPRLPANYSGNAIETAFVAFRARPKGEFETTEEFQRRLTQGPFGVYAFVVPKRYCDVTYDADAGTLQVDVNEIHPAVGYSEGEKAAIELSRLNERQRTYTGTNAFGASVRIHEYAYDSLSITTQRDEIPVLSVEVSRAKAIQLKDAVRVLAVVEFDSNSFASEFYEQLGIATGFRHDKPTFDDPEEITINDYSVSGSLFALWLFDRGTGEVIARFDSASNRVDSAEPPARE